jgi:oligopeptidase B
MENISSKICPPRADVRSHLVHFGKVEGEDRGDNIMEGNDCLKIQDPLFWLRSDSRQDPDVLAYLQKENDYTAYKMFTDSKDTEMFEQIKSGLMSLIKEDDESVKMLTGDQGKDHFYRYYTKSVTGHSHIIHYLELTNKETHQVNNYILVDENSYKNTESGCRCDIENVQISYTHKYLLFGLDTTGNESFDVHMFNIEDLENHVVVGHKLPSINDSDFAMSKNEKFIFYTMTDSVNRQNSLYIYDIATCTSKKMIHEDDPVYSVGFNLMNNGDFLLVNVSSYKTNSVYYVDVSSLDFALIEDSDLSPYLKLIQEKEKDDKYSAKKIGNYFVILTNKLGNTDFIPMYCKIGDDTSEKKWKNINNAKLELKLGKKANDYIFYENMYISKDYVTYNIRHNGITKLVSVKFNPTNDNYPFSDSWTIMSPYEDTGVLSIFNNDYDTNEIIVEYSSLTTPSVYMRYDIHSKSQSILKTREVPTYDRNSYVSSRVYATSHDGKKIPVSIVHRKELDISNGPHKLHLYGYGSYGYTVDSDFDKNIVPLLNRGYIYAIAHVRGGGFMGFKWYESGKMMNKMNTFLDFKAVAEYMISNKYTTSSLMSCEGRSAGGLLTGYCIAKLPHLFNAVIASVPFVDALTTMCDPSIPLTTQEWEQWGNPNNRNSYDYMREYSPYDNIEYNVEYPHFYVTGGLNDPRVGYWEPAKFVAKLRYAHNSLTDKLQVLDMKMNDGHFNSSDRYQYVTEIAKQHLFLAKSENQC